MANSIEQEAHSLIKQYIKFGDRKRDLSSKIEEQIDIAKQNLQTVDKGDMRENFDYNDAKDRLQSLYYQKALFKYWMSNYNNFRKKLVVYLEEREKSAIIDVGSIVRLNKQGYKFTIILVPNHLGNKKISAVNIEAPLGQKLVGKTAGDIVYNIHNNKKVEYIIEEVY